jgi:IclR family KDG regulon transcriptional repressor
MNYMSNKKVPCRVTEISKKLGITKSSVSRILASLERLQWADQIVSEEYILGEKALEFSLSVLSGIDIRNISLPYLKELNNLTLETVGLIIRVDSEFICIDQIEGKNSVRHVLTIGSKQPLWKGCTGKAIMAYIEKEEIDSIISNLKNASPLLLASGQTFDPDKLLAELEEIKRTGFSISLGELTPVTAAIASPVFERNKVVGSIIITGPLPRFNEKLARSYSSALVQTARKISSKLGTIV